MGFLKSKIVVSLLASIALGVVSQNIILPIYRSFKPAAPSWLATTAPALSETVNAVIGNKAQLNGLTWVLDLKKDPFKTIQSLPEKILKPVVKKARRVTKRQKVRKKPSMKSYRLVGIVIEPDVRFAVINDSIVEEGDRYKTFEVVKIDKDSVLLKGEDGYRTLRF